MFNSSQNFIMHASLLVQDLADALHQLTAKAADEQATAAGDKRRLEGVAKTTEGRMAQVTPARVAPNLDAMRCRFLNVE